MSNNNHESLSVKECKGCNKILNENYFKQLDISDGTIKKYMLCYLCRNKIEISNNRKFNDKSTSIHQIRIPSKTLSSLGISNTDLVDKQLMKTILDNAASSSTTSNIVSSTASSSTTSNTAPSKISSSNVAYDGYMNTMAVQSTSHIGKRKTPEDDQQTEVSKKHKSSRICNKCRLIYPIESFISEYFSNDVNQKICLWCKNCRKGIRKYMQSYTAKKSRETPKNIYDELSDENSEKMLEYTSSETSKEYFNNTSDDDYQPPSSLQNKYQKCTQCYVIHESNHFINKFGNKCKTCKKCRKKRIDRYYKLRNPISQSSNISQPENVPASDNISQPENIPTQDNILQSENVPTQDNISQPENVPASDNISQSDSSKFILTRIDQMLCDLNTMKQVIQKYITNNN